MVVVASRCSFTVMFIIANESVHCTAMLTVYHMHPRLYYNCEQHSIESVLALQQALRAKVNECTSVTSRTLLMMDR